MKKLSIKGFLDPADAIVPCACGAKEGEPCRPRARDKAPLEPGYVHISRRVRRLMATARAPLAERARIEAECVSLIVEELRKRKKARR